MVIKIDLTYNIIFERPLLYEIISTKYLAMKFPVDKRMVTVRGNQIVFRKYTSIFLKERMFY